MIIHKTEYFGYFGIATPILTIIPVRSQWGFYKLSSLNPIKSNQVESSILIFDCFLQYIPFMFN